MFNNHPLSIGIEGPRRNFVPVGRAVEKPIDFWLRKGKTGGEPKSTEIKVACTDQCEPIAERDMKCTLIPGIESISGSMKQKNGSRIVFKTFSKPSANRSSKTETRIYFMRRRERSTPLSDNEIAARKRFAEAATYFKNLSEKQRMAYHKTWKGANYCYNGKKYATLRGYIIARFYANDLIN